MPVEDYKPTFLGGYDVLEEMDEMNNQEKELAYFKAAAKQRRTQEKPPFIPCRIRIERRVRGDFPFNQTMVDPGEYDCYCNPFGAVSVKATNGDILGLRLDEFEIIRWKDNPAI